MTSENERQPILYSCYHSRSRSGEQFITNHVFSYQVAGNLLANDGEREHVFSPGEFRFLRRNRLIKFTKVPPADGDFKSVSITFSQEMLRAFSVQHHYTQLPHTEGPTVQHLPGSGLLKSYMESLMPYLEAGDLGQELINVKLTEALLVLLRAHPELKNTLFDFSEPGKIDLEAFMNKNYHFNVGLSRFAYLTGRSLATFKRDFEKLFNTSPSKWLQQRRLREAHYLIAEKGAAPSSVYLELGFEDLSHFSFAFKKMYGVAPSRVVM